jgi:hypothetical protein
MTEAAEPSCKRTSPSNYRSESMAPVVLQCYRGFAYSGRYSVWHGIQRTPGVAQDAKGQVLVRILTGTGAQASPGCGPTVHCFFTG